MLNYTMCRTMAIQNDNLAPEGESLCTADGSNWNGTGIIAYSWQTRPGLGNAAFLQTALPLLIILIVSYATVQDAARASSCA